MIFFRNLSKDGGWILCFTLFDWRMSWVSRVSSQAMEAIVSLLWNNPSIRLSSFSLKNNTLYFSILSYFICQIQFPLPPPCPVSPLFSPIPPNPSSFPLQKTGRGNPVRWKESQEQAKESETSPTPSARNPIRAPISTGWPSSYPYRAHRCLFSLWFPMTRV